MRKPHIFKGAGMWIVTPPIVLPLDDSELQERWRKAWLFCHVRNITEPRIWLEQFARGELD